MPLNRRFYAAVTIDGTNVYSSDRHELEKSRQVIGDTIRETTWGEVRDLLIAAMKKQTQ
jgi:hypothetical protein